jgi:hypothetical protein
VARAALTNPHGPTGFPTRTTARSLATGFLGLAPRSRCDRAAQTPRPIGTERDTAQAMSRENIEAARRWLKAINGGSEDFDRAVALVHRDIVFVPPGDEAPYRGAARAVPRARAGKPFPWNCRGTGERSEVPDYGMTVVPTGFSLRAEPGRSLARRSDGRRTRLRRPLGTSAESGGLIG